jgi:IPT/TIG domain/Glycosyl hydrolase family 26
MRTQKIWAGLMVLATATVIAFMPLSSTSSAATVPLLGSYDGSNNPAGVSAFAAETGGTASIYSDYLQGSAGWPGEVGTSTSSPWILSQLKGKLGGSRLVLSVPLQDISGESNQQSLASYAANPATWDAEFSILAKNLVADGFSNAIIRLMWEPDSLGIYSNDDLTSAANYATVWRDAYGAMASVAGANFAWAWYWAATFDATTDNTAYPGNAYVNYVSLDFYDQSWISTCAIPYNGTVFSASQEACLWSAPNGYSAVLKSFSNFANGVQKPMAFGEWGEITRADKHGGGDDPTFINDFSAWLKTNNVAWISYFDFNSGGNSILANYPNSLAAYKTDLGSGGGSASTTTTTTQPQATTTTTTTTSGIVVTGVSPNSGPAGGGTTVTVTGTGFSSATVVDFGSAAATIKSVSATAITVVAPPIPAGVTIYVNVGVAYVTVGTPSGKSQASSAGIFRYISS